MNSKDILSARDYRNYRDVRAVAVLFVVLGGVLVLGGMALIARKKPERGRETHPALAIAIASLGATGVIGGIATLRGNRRWAPLVYLMAGLYLFAFPIGTILSYVMLSGLSRYLDSTERIRLARVTDG
jgi:sulfite exporter TauE/SafE